MNTLIETLNRLGENALHFARPMLWQSSVLIAALFVADFALRQRVRAAVRYALWLVLLVKLLLPPSLALPTGVAWWLFPAAAPANPQTTRFVVSYGADTAPSLPSQPAPAFTPPRPPMSAAAWTILAWSAISVGLLAWLTARWRRVTHDVRCATPAPAWLNELFDEAKGSAGLRRPVRLRLTDQAMSPAVCGLFRPVILLPQSLVEKLPPTQLRAVLLHELIHLRRGDVWANCVQSLLQIVYWWHPLLWLANARIRRIREEAVDDTVMLTLRDDAESYAPTLLEVAKLAFHRPLASLGLVGILESRSALRQRIERLVNFRAPRKAGLTLVSLCGICIFSATALPMGESPAPSSDASKVDRKENAGLPLDSSPPQIHIKARFIEVPEETVKGLGTNLIPTGVTSMTGVLTGPNLRLLIHALEQSKGTETLAEPEVTTTSGRQTQMRATEIITIITNFVFQEFPTNSAITPQTTKVECGPVLDTVASVLPDGYTIDLKTTASLTEFLGYDTPTNTIPAATSTGAIVDVPKILPSFRVSQASAHLKLWDGQTVVLGMPQGRFLVSENLGIPKDRFLAGGKEVGAKPSAEDKALLVFITVTLVDPAGNRLHSEDARNSIPPQSSP
jgi:beta-lactamase regulating signal transducer with metallopeptidase domain